MNNLKDISYLEMAYSLAYKAKGWTSPNPCVGAVIVKNGRITFFDWGDADITHPFVSLRTFFVSIEMSLELDDYEFTPEMAALLDIYLKPFGEFATKGELIRTQHILIQQELILNLNFHSQK